MIIYQYMYDWKIPLNSLSIFSYVHMIIYTSKNINFLLSLCYYQPIGEATLLDHEHGLIVRLLMRCLDFGCSAQS